MVKPRFVALFIFLALIVSSGPVAFAEEGTTGDYFRDIGTKFGRGVWNILSSPAEIPCAIQHDLKQNVATGLFTGGLTGVAFFARRIFAGVTEVGTFMIPMEATLPPVCHTEQEGS